MSLFEELKNQGVDVDEGVARVMGDAALYETMLGKFIDTVNRNPVSPEDFNTKDIEALIERVHLLKGFTGNLSMNTLFAGYTQVLTLLRAGQVEAARMEYERIPAAQAAIMDCIRRYAGA